MGKYNYSASYIVVFEAMAEDGKYGLGLFYTSQTPHLFAYDKCENWIKYGFTHGNINMIYCFKGNKKYDLKSKKFKYHLEEALLTYKKGEYDSIYRQYVIENCLEYFFVKVPFKSEDFELKTLRKCCKCSFEKVEKYKYKKPKNKWVQEEFLYNTIKELYKKYKVIYQYRPAFLKSEIGGQLSYDIFIKDLNVAVEYQGKQHFEPVDFFGGEESFQRTIIRDKIKKELSELHGIILVCFEYNENITKNFVKKKIESARNTFYTKN